ncbi:hypothetical protein MRS76_11245 [Rhizobiaceae bacterium n13]|uniref:major capsid protein n=1 Tax=Ferirhizobium litorale TaxID=2927786 RepID=UPI0024B31B4D|nr:hypothetical protein [Fererhizobium litorale]MDI7862536.1 hypothetical protein [Fererhizobium litorale]
MPEVMTLPEYAKGLEKTSIERPLIETFASESDILQVLPFEGFTGAAFEGYRETDVGQAAFRAINEGAGSSKGKIAPFQETSFPIDTILKVDKAILLRHGESRRAKEEAMQMKAQSRLFTNAFLSGDNTSNPKEPNGLKARCTLANGRLMHNSAANGGAALSLYNLDKAIMNTRNANFIIAGLDLLPRFIQAARNTSVAGFVIQSWDEVGIPKMSYAGKRILFGYPKGRDGVILPFNEVASGGGSAVTTSLFVANISAEGLHGIQLKNMEVRDMGLLEDAVNYGTNVSWDVGLVDEADFCVTRLTSITDAAFVA